MKVCERCGVEFITLDGSNRDICYRCFMKLKKQTGDKE